ncbi:hypothetical protein [Streptomyces albidus (ex Kaewkla and Franco 2022)]|uniref:hypothetical protein n=1 Tax=Streptomyces albidus (ex Kaewkla and Franco 2022) TaxID=722709 RepID=UPI0015EEF9DC|nr:hypothetical protein [Streptomyces albidus (ex Kaewkla and Franco 2022)]
MGRGNGRLLAAGATVVLLAGCGTSGEAGSDGEPEALSRKQAQSVVPDQEAMHGWRMTTKPSALPMKGIRQGGVCEGATDSCKGARFYSASNFLQKNKSSSVSFSLVAYNSQQAAGAAYDAMWKLHSKSMAPHASKIKLDTEERSDARLGVIGFKGEPGAVVQMRVGTALSWVQLRGVRKGAFDEELVKDLATMLDKRGQEANNGGTATTRLRH